MCGRYVLFTDEEADDIADIIQGIQQSLYGAESGGQTAAGEIFPTAYVPVLTANGPAAMTWGLPGFKNAGVIINARAESVFEKPTFRQAMLARRCIVPSHGFFEWRKTPGGKEKLLFRLPAQKCLYMAGLYNIYNNEPRFAILTTDANESMRPVHHRMPVIVPPSELAAYISDENTARTIAGRIPPELVYIPA